MTELMHYQKMHIRSHFGFAKVPFAKNMKAIQMFDSSSQKELIAGLHFWRGILGLSLVTGPPGVGKSISLRSFTYSLDQDKFRVILFSHIPTTTTGFLRSLCRKLELPMRFHATDLFDQAQTHLASYQQDHGAHPLLLIDDGEGLSIQVIDLLRRLTCYDLDSEDRFSILLAGTDDLLGTLAHPALESLRTRFSYVQALRPFGLEDTRNYIRFHLKRVQAPVPSKLFSDAAIQRLFQASGGKPRAINQLALQSLISAAVKDRKNIDGDFMTSVIQSHPLFQGSAHRRS